MAGKQLSFQKYFSVTVESLQEDTQIPVPHENKFKKVSEVKVKVIIPLAFKIKDKTRDQSTEKRKSGSSSDLIADRMCETNPKAKRHTHTFSDTHTLTPTVKC